MNAVRDVMLYEIARVLRRVNRDKNAPVSAGELAKVAGMSRSTIKKYMRTLVKNGVAMEIEMEHVNKQPMTLYASLDWMRQNAT